jgi:hypothetical protein
MFCGKCGLQLNEDSAFCSRCGARVAPIAAEVAVDVSSKSRLATTLLACFLGQLGAHRFYAGKIGTAVAMLVLSLARFACWAGVFLVAATTHEEEWPALFWLFFGLFASLCLVLAIWNLIDFIIAVTGNFKDSEGKTVKKW